MSKPASIYFEASDVTLYWGDCRDILALLPVGHFNMIFADPPYFLSNNGTTCQSGKRANVNKGPWDHSHGVIANHQFILEWLEACRRVMHPDATIWISGTHHIIHSVGFALQKLGFRILNDIIWYKLNPPPNLGCRCFTHATETIIWAARSHKSRYIFNYELMKRLSNEPFDRAGRQMKNIWGILPPRPYEKKLGKHPTQKPLALLERILLAASRPGDIILDPFLGSGTTAVAALQLKRRFVGIELEPTYLHIARARIEDYLEQRPMAFSDELG